MPSSDYSTPVRGALKLKGGVPNPSGVTKKKKKKSSSSSKPLTDLERNLSTGGEEDNERSISLAPEVKDGKGKEKIQQEEDKKQQQLQLQQQKGGNDDSDSDSKNKTEAERRFAEVKRKRVCINIIYPPSNKKFRVIKLIFISFSLKKVKRTRIKRPSRGKGGGPPSRASQNAQAARRGT